MEIFFIKAYNCRNHDIGYNIKEGGSAGRHSEETKAKISATLKAIASTWSPEEKAARAAPISEYWEGKLRGPHTDEWKENNSKMMLERHKNTVHPMLGKHHTEEAKQKISNAGKGRVVSPETTIKRGLIHRMKPEREKGIIKDYQDGLSIEEIIEKFTTKESTIYRVLDRNNISYVIVKKENKGWVGKTHTEETKLKMANSRKKYWEDKKANKK